MKWRLGPIRPGQDKILVANLKGELTTLFSKLLGNLFHVHFQVGDGVAVDLIENRMHLVVANLQATKRCRDCENSSHCPSIQEADYRSINRPNHGSHVISHRGTSPHRSPIL